MPLRFASLVLALALAVSLSGCGSPPAKDYPPANAQTILDLAAQSKGKVVLVNFWATWCGPCRMEFSELMQLRQSFTPEELVLAGVSVDDSVDEVRAFFGSKNVNYPIYHAQRGTSDAFGLQGVPGFVFFTRDGQIAYKHAGFLTTAQLTAAVRKLLETEK